MRLKELRKNKRVSQLKLAMDLNMNQNTISRYETGEREPGINEIIKIADYFGVTVDYLLGNKEKEPPTNSDEALMFALYGDDNKDITPELLDEVRAFAKFARERKKESK